jgi:hypothetical protein
MDLLTSSIDLRSVNPLSVRERLQPFRGAVCFVDLEVGEVFV